MEPTVLQTSEPPVHFLNIEYFFRILYEVLFMGGRGGAGGFSPDSILIVLGKLWLALSAVSYLASLALIWALIFYTLRYWQIKKEDEQRYTTITKEEAVERLEDSRWAYIQQLIESPSEASWRQAIIDADIMLDDMLAKHGYPGATLGEKLQGAKFATLQNAWDAHRVRNEIAHQGSSYELSNSLAYRTVKNYESVFREFNEI